MTFRKIFGCCISCLIMLSASAQQSQEQLVRTTHYLLYLPDGYAQDTVKRWPLMLFLHGSGESGVNELEKVKKHGPPKLIAGGKQYPFIVVSPQAEPRFGWEAEELYHLLLDIKKQYRVDADRIYLTGLSMGGFGTWDLAMKHPEEFAAIAPICGGGDTSTIWKLRYMPVWCFHGAKDDVVPPDNSIRMIRALRRVNPGAKLTIYPDANHDSWTTTYNNDSLYQWLLSQQKFRFREVTVPQAVLNSYAGKYVFNKDTLRIAAVTGKLLAITSRRDTITLKAAAADLFFWEDDTVRDVRFVKQGKDKGFIVSTGNRTFFKKEE